MRTAYKDSVRWRYRSVCVKGWKWRTCAFLRLGLMHNTRNTNETRLGTQFSQHPIIHVMRLRAHVAGPPESSLAKGRKKKRNFLNFNSSLQEQSHLCIWDAEMLHLSSQPIARIIMPQRVPFGVHSNFLNAEELALQWQTFQDAARPL